MRIPKGGIAFFDSGIGGLTVLCECAVRLPNEPFYYFGDNRHAPYGNLPEKKIKKLVFRAFRKFARLRVKAAVLACNTATATCVEELRKTYPFPIVGAEPAILSAAKGGGEVFVLATAATCASARFRCLVHRAQKSYPTASLRVCPCPDLAGAIETHIHKNGVGCKTLPLPKLLPQGTPTAVVLGCTHYIYIKKEIGDFYKARVYDGNAGIATRLASLLSPPSNDVAVDNVAHKPQEGSVDNLTGKPQEGKTGGMGEKIEGSAENGKKDREKQPLLTPPKKHGQKPPIFFLGSQKRQNERVFEQMFANVRK